MSIIYNWSSAASGASGVLTFATFADFPATAADGTLALALDTDILYAFNMNTMLWVPIGAPITLSYVVDLFTLSSGDIAAKFVTLSTVPTAPLKTIVTVVGGPMQSYGTDFIVDMSNHVDWSGFFLDGVLVAGDKLIIQYI